MNLLVVHRGNITLKVGEFFGPLGRNEVGPGGKYLADFDECGAKGLKDHTGSNRPGEVLVLGRVVSLDIFPGLAEQTIETGVSDHFTETKRGEDLEYFCQPFGILKRPF